jgi:hypothetical protein
MRCRSPQDEAVVSNRPPLVLNHHRRRSGRKGDEPAMSTGREKSSISTSLRPEAHADHSRGPRIQPRGRLVYGSVVSTVRAGSARIRELSGALIGRVRMPLGLAPVSQRRGNLHLRLGPTGPSGSGSGTARPDVEQPIAGANEGAGIGNPGGSSSIPASSGETVRVRVTPEQAPSQHGPP